MFEKVLTNKNMFDILITEQLFATFVRQAKDEEKYYEKRI